MSDTTEQPQEPQEGVVEAAATTTSTETAEAAQSGAAGAGEPDKFEGLPENFDWLKKGYNEARRESQSLRERLREAESAAQEAKSPEEFAAVQQQLAEVQRTLTVRDLAAEHGLPDEALSLMDGVPTEQLEERAKALAALLPKAPVVEPVVVTKVPLSGGADPSQEPTEKGGDERMREFLKSNPRF